MNHLLGVPVVVLAFFVQITDTTAEEASPQKQLKAWGEEFVATWVLESELDADVAELGKKGDSLKMTAKVVPASGIYQVTWQTEINGELTESGAGTVGWDPTRKVIRLESFTSLGGRMTASYARKRETWTSKGITYMPDGTKESQRGTLTASEESHVWHFTNRKRGDEELPDRTDTFTRN